MPTDLSRNLMPANTVDLGSSPGKGHQLPNCFDFRDLAFA